LRDGFLARVRVCSWPNDDMQRSDTMMSDGHTDGATPLSIWRVGFVVPINGTTLFRWRFFFQNSKFAPKMPF